MSDRLFLSSGGYPPIVAESNDTEFIKLIIRLGLGLALVPNVTIMADKDTDMRILRIKGHAMPQDFGLVYRSDMRMRALSAFCDLCRSRPPIRPPAAAGFPVPDRQR